jgi:DNA-binding transcriptional LysR family regulator
MDLEDLRALISVIEHGSIQSAAAATRAARTTLRRRLESLEAELGVPLLVRGTAGAVPTPAGQLLAERGRTLLQEGAALASAIRELDQAPEGVLRALVPVGLPPHLLAAVLSMAAIHLPRMQFHLSVAEDPVRALREDVDMVLHFGPPPERGPWISTVLAPAPERLLASPSYLAARGTPLRAEDLAAHTLLSWRPPGEDGRAWPLRGGGSLPVSPTLITSDVHLVRQFASAGQGIALIPDGGVPDGPDMRGELVGVLGAVVGRPNALRVLMPEPMARLPKGRAIIAMARDLVAGLSVLDPERASG